MDIETIIWVIIFYGFYIGVLGWLIKGMDPSKK